MDNTQPIAKNAHSPNNGNASLKPSEFRSASSPIILNVSDDEIIINAVPVKSTNSEQIKKNRFRGVLRKKAKSYFITGIDLDSTQEGLYDFLDDLGITYKLAKFLYTRRTDCQVAQIVVDEDQTELIEDQEIWPEGITCREWMKRTDYKTSRTQRHDVDY